jgi:cardiolipin synthase
MKFDRSFFKKLYTCEKRVTFPTLLTIVRIILTPVIVIAMIKQQWSYAFFWFVIASLTDMFDGALARRWNVQTVLGACLDPIADKVLLISCFAALAFIQAPSFVIPHWFVLFILCKELVIVFGSLALLVTKAGFVVRPTMLGKATTVVQMLLIAWLFFCYFFNWVPTKTYYVLMGLTIGVTVAAFAQYLSIGFKYLLKMRRNHEY